jgi:DNA polymerase-3 subunit alpha
MGKDVAAAEIFNPEHERYGEGAEFRAIHESEPVREVVDTAIGIEGLKRQWGVHAAGVIMSSEPDRRHPDHEAGAGRPDHHPVRLPDLRALGLVKMDFLGLRNLTILDDAVATSAINRGEEIDLDALARRPDDPAPTSC